MSHNPIELASQVLSLDDGLFAIRQTPTQDTEVVLAGLVFSTTPMNTAEVAFLGSNDQTPQIKHASDCLVIHVTKGPASLVVTRFSSASAAHQPIRLSVERLDGALASKTPQASPAAAPIAAPPKAPATPPLAVTSALAAPPASAVPPVAPLPLPAAVKMLALFGEIVPTPIFAHIERLGDVRIEHAWIGHPERTQRIEGFSLDASHLPSDVNLFYGCASGAVEKMALYPAGHFVGTRQKALPITALAFSLQGPGKEGYMLLGQVVFDGCEPQSLDADKVLSGKTGQEPLVAFYAVLIKKKQKAAPSKVQPSAPAAASAWENPSLTQIFKKG